MKVFDLCVGAIGLSLEVAKAEGFDAVEAFGVQYDHAHFFPDRDLMFLHLIADRSTRRVLGIQGIGAMGDGLLARVNAAAGLLERKAVISDFSNLEIAYAPPFSSAVDILNATANIADNLVSGRLRIMDVGDFDAWLNGEASHPDWLAVDLRNPKEAEPFTEKFKDRWIILLYDKFRDDYEQLPKDKLLILICNAGSKAYEVQCFLNNLQIKNTVVLAGGLNVVRKLGVKWWPDAS